jgi:hypothetical protein
MWWVIIIVVFLVLFWWGHSQYALANCMADAANPASPTHRLASEFGWKKDTLFKLYLARRSMRNKNTVLGTRELKIALDMHAKDLMTHSEVSPLTIAKAEEQSLLAMAYALDNWNLDRLD